MHNHRKNQLSRWLLLTILSLLIISTQTSITTATTQVVGYVGELPDSYATSGDGDGTAQENSDPETTPSTEDPATEPKEPSDQTDEPNEIPPPDSTGENQENTTESPSDNQTTNNTNQNPTDNTTKIESSNNTSENNNSRNKTKPNKTYTETLTNITNKTIFIKPGNNSDVDIENIVIKPIKNLTELNLTIIKLEEKPPELPDPPFNNSIYSYLNISFIFNETTLENEDFESINFSFKVNKTWLEEQNISNESISLMQYNNGVWEVILTTLYSEDTKYCYYTLTDPAQSTFAIIGNELKLSTPYQTTSIPAAFILGIIVGATIVFIVVLFKAKYIYSDTWNKNSTNKKILKTQRRKNTK